MLYEVITLTKNNKQATKRNRLMLELMARGGMRVGEVLNLTPADIQERSLAIQNPKVADLVRRFMFHGKYW